MNSAVTTPARAILTTGVCVRGVTIIIQQCILLADFIVLLKKDFNAIFSLDWLARYGTLIYYKKKIQLCLKHNMKISFKGKGRVKGGYLISFHHTNRLID